MQSLTCVGRRQLAFAAIGMALATAPGVAQADFLPAFRVSDGQVSGRDADVALGADGNALVVWHRFRLPPLDRIMARAVLANGMPGPLEFVSHSSVRASNPSVAMSPDGDAAIVWGLTSGQVQGRFRLADGTFSPVRTLNNTFGTYRDSQVVINSDGEALAAWVLASGDHRLEVRAFSASGVLGPVEEVFRTDASVERFRLAMDSSGNALIAWEYRIGATSRVAVRSRSAAGNFGPVQLSVLGRDPDVAFDGGGNALITWSGIQAVIRSSAGTFGQVQDVGTGEGARVAVRSDGAGAIVWVAPVGADSRIHARMRSASGTLGPTRLLSQGYDASSPQVVVQEDGDAVVAWRDIAASTEPARVRARTISAASVLGPIQTLGVRSSQPQLGIDANSNVLAVWTRSGTSASSSVVSWIQGAFAPETTNP